MYKLTFEPKTFVIISNHNPMVYRIVMQEFVFSYINLLSASDVLLNRKKLRIK